MTPKENAIAVLRLCEDDPEYDNLRLETDIAGHIMQHMGIEKWPTWRPIYEYIGFDMQQGAELWYLLNEEWPKDRVLRVFHHMIEKAHGPVNHVPASRRLL